MFLFLYLGLWELTFSRYVSRYFSEDGGVYVTLYLKTYMNIGAYSILWFKILYCFIF